MGALGLVVNMIVLWSTLYMEAAVNHLRASGAVISTENLARLFPVGHDHINLLGRYLFALAEQVAHGQLRPLILQQASGLP